MVLVVIITVTAIANSQNISDVSIIIPLGLVDALASSIKAGITACGAARKVRRQASICNN